jgi:arsenate reductase (thioredoxin)
LTSPDTPPVVLYACVHNSGRSVTAKLLTEHYAGDRLQVRSAGSEPARSVNAEITRVLSERGISTGSETPTRLTADVVETADVVVTMGCGETCPVFPGKRYLDWDVEDPAGRDREAVRRIVDEIDRRVKKLLDELGVEVPTST